MYRAKTNILSLILKALLFALLVGIILGYLFGYRYILVNGWSSEPYIHYQSLILTSPTKLQNLKVGDFITYTSSKQAIFAKQSNVTHQIIAIKYDGYFKEYNDETGEGDIVTMIADGIEYQVKFGYDIKIDDDGNVTYEKMTNVPTNCNIITMQRQQGKANISATKEYKNFDQVVGKVVGQSVMLGKTLFLIMGNPLILVGLLGCFVLLFVLKEQFSTDNLRIYK